jgi:hypothetical protein
MLYLASLWAALGLCIGALFYSWIVAAKLEIGRSLKLLVFAFCMLFVPAFLPAVGVTSAEFNATQAIGFEGFQANVLGKFFRLSGFLFLVTVVSLGFASALAFLALAMVNFSIFAVSSFVRG